MARIRVSIVISASPRAVWRAIEDIESHVRWMEDAEAIRITSRSSRGVGTTFECDTRAGPFTTVDHMEIVEWQPRKAMGVRHLGAVSGEGRFTLRALGRSRTKFTWREQLTFPWWLGGGVGGVFGAEVLRVIWKRNLRNLKQLVES
jgi:uncharacterized protein YndB with AHSA1/START domain